MHLEEFLMLRLLPFIVTIIIALTITGCHKGKTPIAPDGDDESLQETQLSDSFNSRVIWGAYTAHFDFENLEVSIEPANREASTHFDVTAIFSPPFCPDCINFDIHNWDPLNRIIDLTLTLKNPTAVTAYDVRTVIQNYDVMEFFNADGYTELWNTPGTRDPFYNFAKENPVRAFLQFATNSRRLEVRIPESTTGYVTILVDASWPEQSTEPYEIRTGVSGWLVNDGNDNTKIIAYVSDHQGDVESVTADLTPLGKTQVAMYDDGDHGDGNAGDGIFGIKGITTIVPTGIVDIWVATKSFGSTLYTYQKASVTVADVDPYHGDPDYERLFDESVVKDIHVFMSPDQWEAMQQDLVDQIPLPWEEREFSYFECEVMFEGVVWQHVGIRYKGNSSIQHAWNIGSQKYPFRLDFDEYEDEYPETNDQRFWGMKWMIFNNNMNDPAMLRELITYGLFRAYNMPASRAAHYRVFLDHGEGPVYHGLFTSVEEIDNRFLTDRFGDNDGNLYEPTHAGVDLSQFNQDDFDKITNENDNDWTDLIHFIDVLNADYPNPADFKAAIQQVFHVDAFIKWLAANTILCNIDSYAGTGHNYFLYNNPVDGLFYLIPWDCNESMGGFCGSIGPDNMHLWDILHPQYESPKPLVDRILEVPEYLDSYKLTVRSILDGMLEEGAAYYWFDTLHMTASPYVVGPDGEFPPYTLLGDQQDFIDNLDQDVPYGAPERHLGLKSFLADRRAYIDSVIP